MSKINLKRGIEEDTEDDVIGPKPSEATEHKKQKVLPFESVYLDNLPSADSYEISYMHRDVVNYVAVGKDGFLITTSTDGHLKFWKKHKNGGIEFVKHFRSHRNAIMDLAVSANGEYCSTTSDDCVVKVYDVINFDMINMVKIAFQAQCCCWVYNSEDSIPAIAIAEKGTANIHMYDSRGNGECLHSLTQLHFEPVYLMRYNTHFKTTISVDESGVVECWGGASLDYTTSPKCLTWKSKMETDLYEFVKTKSLPLDICFSSDGSRFATISDDRRMRVFRFASGKLVKVIDESLKRFTEMKQSEHSLSNMEFSKRMAVEKELQSSPFNRQCSIIFDESNNFIFYSTMLGIKVVNLYTNKCSRIIGSHDNVRFLQLALYQGTSSKVKANFSCGADSFDHHQATPDPTLFCTAFKKNRLYLFSKREPDDKMNGESNRDIFNEKPSKEEMVAATEDILYTRIADSAVIHTTFGDIILKLFGKECPKTVENFCVHSRDGYYNGNIIHRVIKGFMIQTGDPDGNGTGGQSIWGGEFEDEIHPMLKHDAPFTVSMANAGPNSNGSQFFITVVPTPWLDKKHTVFGRVTGGMEVVMNLANVKTNPKDNKPYDDVSIVSISVK